MNTAQLIAALAAQAAQGVQTNTPADGYVHAVGRLMEQASQWSAITAAGVKCSITVVSHHEHSRCTMGAIGVCLGCEHPVCFGHALISPNNGDMICYGCVSKVARRSRRSVSRETPPSAGHQAHGHQAQSEPQGPHTECTCKHPWQLDEDCPLHRGQHARQHQGTRPSGDALRIRRRHLEVLDLEDDSDWEDVQFAYRRMIKRHHPDRHPPSKRKRQEARLKTINAAYAWLKKHYEEAA